MAVAERCALQTLERSSSENLCYGLQVLPFHNEKKGEIIIDEFQHGSHEELSIPKVADL